MIFFNCTNALGALTIAIVVSFVQPWSNCLARIFAVSWLYFT